MNKSLVLQWYQKFAPLAFSTLGIWLGYHLYVTPFLSSNKILADPVYISAFGMGASIGFLTFAPLIIKHTSITGSFDIKLFFRYLTILGLIGTCVNGLILHIPINNRQFIECPSELGYRHNLLKSYVPDIKSCEQL